MYHPHDLRRAVRLALILAGTLGTTVRASSVRIPPDAPAPSAQEPTLEDRLSGIDAAMQKIEDLSAEFKQSKFSALLRRPAVSAGSLTARGSYVLWRTTDPRRSDMWVGPGEVRLYYPEDRLVEIYRADAMRDIAGGPLPKISVLRERFELIEIDPEMVREEAASPVEEPGAAGRPSDAAPPAEPSAVTPRGAGKFIGVQFTPKDQGLLAHLARVLVRIDPSVPCITRVVMVNADGESTRVDFSRVRINQGLSEDAVELRLPEGVRESRPLEGRSVAPADPADRAR